MKATVVVEIDGARHLYASYAALGMGLGSAAHASADIYNTGKTHHPTGLATQDGAGFRWRDNVFEIGAPDSWDGYQARLGAVDPTEDGFVGFYDGSARHAENYEAPRPGHLDGRPLVRRVSTRGPWLTGPGPTGSIRYVDVAVRDGAWWVYHEASRPDGAHELRLGITQGPPR